MNESPPLKPSYAQTRRDSIGESEEEKLNLAAFSEHEVKILIDKIDICHFSFSLSTSYHLFTLITTIIVIITVTTIIIIII